MASYNKSMSMHATLSAGTPDSVTLAGGGVGFEVVNRHQAQALYFSYTVDGTDPVVATIEGDNTFYVGPMSRSKTIINPGVGNMPYRVSVVGNANAYSVQTVCHISG